MSRIVKPCAVRVQRADIIGLGNWPTGASSAAAVEYATVCGWHEQRPAYRLRFHGLASAPTIERFYRLMRQVIAIAEESTAPFEGAIECDETIFGGYRAGKRRWGALGKVIVLGILQRNGVVRVFPVKGRGRAELERSIVTHTLPGSLYYTDDWQAYASLAVHRRQKRARQVAWARSH